MSIFRDKYSALLKELEKGRTMVLSSSSEGRVSSRMMSVVAINGAFYFQTDKTMRKYSQLVSSPYVALCADNIQIEGICREIGHPMDNAEFRAKFRQCFKGSFEAYSALENERLFSVVPLYIERWLYLDGRPFIESFDFEQEEYCLNEYTVK